VVYRPRNRQTGEAMRMIRTAHTTPCSCGDTVALYEIPGLGVRAAICPTCGLDQDFSQGLDQDFTSRHQRSTTPRTPTRRPAMSDRKWPTSRSRKVLQAMFEAVAYEASMCGRIYTQLGEKESPAEFDETVFRRCVAAAKRAQREARDD